jgi:2-(1,2-epoxy-1,2-dihydrophenyl)acetyl-CoA isomerase
LPVIAAVNGVAVGAGLDLACVADIRFASSTARFGSVYSNVGLCPDAGGSYFLPRIVGEARALDLIYTGRIINADEAHNIGLVSEVFDPEELMDKTMEYAALLASRPTVALGQSKLNVRASWSMTFEDALRAERRGTQVCHPTDDHHAGVAAAKEGKKAEFLGK